MSAPDKIWVAGQIEECGNYYSEAVEAEGEHGGFAVAYTRTDAIPSAAYVAGLEMALNDARLQLLYMDARSPSGTTINAIARIDAALASRPASPDVRVVTVEPLEWVRGIVDVARPIPGMKYVACSTTPAGSWAWWLEDAADTRGVYPREADAKAAAQADYERRILSAIIGIQP